MQLYGRDKQIARDFKGNIALEAYNPNPKPNPSPNPEGNMALEAREALLKINQLSKYHNAMLLKNEENQRKKKVRAYVKMQFKCIC